MKHIGKLAWIAILTTNIAYADGQLNIYNWSDYIAEDTMLILRQRQLFQ